MSSAVNHDRSSAERDDPTVQVDVGPGEAAKLRTPKACHRSHSPDAAQPVIGRAHDELSEALGSHTAAVASIRGTLGDSASSAGFLVSKSLRRHAATNNLCLKATIRADGSPRISPIEPPIFEDRLLLVDMPGTITFHDLGPDPRF
ncbi:MAG: hypothetical protein ABR609_10280 [Acidimicrobiia bacterium]